MEWAGMYAVNWVRKMAHEQIHSVEPEQEAIDDFNVHTQEFLKRTVHTSHCRSRYKNNKVDGPVAAMWAGLPMQFKDMMSVQRGVDFDIKYCCPTVSDSLEMESVEEMQRIMDLSYYLRKDGWNQEQVKSA
jgi:hypothetical protein